MDVKIVVVPVFKRKWLYQACSDTSSIQTEDIDPCDPIGALGKKISERFSDIARTQWASLQAAPPGSLKNRIFGVAQSILSREDPVELFLKSIPGDAQRLEILYPSTMCETQVRQRLRILCAHGAVHHQRNLVGWGILTLPQLPLMLTPLPNVTLYYSAYRLMSHWQACAGAAALQRAFQQPGAVVMRRVQPAVVLRLADPLLVRQLAAKEDEHRHRHKRQGSVTSVAPAPPAPVFVASKQLDDMVRPLEWCGGGLLRWKSPLPDDMIPQLVSTWTERSTELFDQVARVRQRFASTGVDTASPLRLST